MNTDRILILTGINTKSIHSEAPLSSFSAVSFKTVKKPKLKTVSAWKQQQSCIPCHFLTANNTKLQLTFALYFLYVSETNLIKLWFYSYFLSVLKDTDFVYFTFSTGSTTQGLFHDPVTLDPWSSYTGFTHCSFVSPLINSETFASPLLQPQDYNGTTNNQNIYVFGAFVSISQSSFVSLFCFTVIPMEGNLSN